MKRFLAITFAAMFAVCSYAQGVRFGVKGGVNFSKESDNAVMVKYDVKSTSSFRTAFHLGGVMNMAFNKRLALETDLMYSMQGVNDYVYSNISLTDKIHFHFTSHYITVPVAIKYYPIDRFYVECGPQLGFLLSKKFGSSSDDDELDKSFDTSECNVFDFGILGGIGFNVTDNVFVEAKYIHGFCDTFKNMDGYKNRNIQLSVGYLF